MFRRPPTRFLAAARHPALPLAILTALLVVAAFPPAAPAAPTAPELLETDPLSPGASPTPRVLGRRSGRTIKESWGPDRGVTAPRLAATDGEPEISIYTDPDCEGTLVASGPAGELENGGIEVTVAPDSTTDFYATQTEGGETSTCSAGIEYRQVTAAPPAPTVTSVDPVGPADDNAPRVIGTAAEGATVSIYADPSCAGASLGAGDAATFAGPGVPATVADNSTTTLYAAASWAGMKSPCSASSVTYQEVTVAPPPGAPGGGAGGGSTTPGAAAGPPGRPALRTVPGGRANDLAPLLVALAPGAERVEVFNGPGCHGPGAASGSAAELAAGVAVAVAPNATTTFSAAAVGAGGRSRCSAPVTYTEDSLPPRTRITMGPGIKTRRHRAVFRFADVTEDPPGTTFRCKVNKRRWRPCASPLRLKHLRRRRYVVRIRATDLAGNVERRPVRRRFRVIGHRSRAS